MKSLADTTATSLSSLTATTEKNFAFLSGALVDVKSQQDDLSERQDNLETFIFGTPLKAKAAFAKMDRTGYSFADLVNEAKDDFDMEEDDDNR